MTFDRRTLLVTLLFYCLGVFVYGGQLSEPDFPTRLNINIDSKKTFYQFDYEIDTLGTNDVKVDLSVYKGKVLVVHYVNIDQTISEAMIVLWQEFYNRYKENSDVKIIFICFDNTSKADMVAGSLAVTYPIYVRSWKEEKLYMSEFPTSFIIDRQGYVVFRHAGLAEWNGKATDNFLRMVASLGS